MVICYRGNSIPICLQNLGSYTVLSHPRYLAFYSLRQTLHPPPFSHFSQEHQLEGFLLTGRQYQIPDTLSSPGNQSMEVHAGITSWWCLKLFTPGTKGAALVGLHNSHLHPILEEWIGHAARWVSHLYHKSESFPRRLQSCLPFWPLDQNWVPRLPLIFKEDWEIMEPYHKSLLKPNTSHFPGTMVLPTKPGYMV